MYDKDENIFVRGKVVSNSYSVGLIDYGIVKVFEELFVLKEPYKSLPQFTFVLKLDSALNKKFEDVRYGAFLFYLS